MKRKAFLAPLVALGLAATLTSTISPAQAAAAVDARNDSAKVTAGKQVVVNVLANDRVQGKSRAKVRVVSKPRGFTAKVDTARRVVVKPAATTKAGTYRVKYQVVNPKGKKDAAFINVRVAAKPSTPSVDPKSLRGRVAALKVATERRTGYDRDLFKHWNAGTNSGDGCDTRREVLIVEAIKKPKVGSKCSFTGGEWHSQYDGVIATDASKFDIDHMVPLAEAWDSGAYAWTDARREAYANDQGDARSLIAVSAGSNRSKGDKDPAEWRPSQHYGSYAMSDCRYIEHWVAVKTRWSLTVDSTEKKFLTDTAAKCTNIIIDVTVVK